ncbi:MAG: hypothetical protein GW893_09870 [Armatimonadetes bacterium]|nr:hypothetical protein [Armatimonadota bacterium]
MRWRYGERSSVRERKLAASRASWHDHFSNYGGWWGPRHQAQIQMHHFVARFGQYLRAPELR